MIYQRQCYQQEYYFLARCQVVCLVTLSIVSTFETASCQIIIKRRWLSSKMIPFFSADDYFYW